MTVNGAPERPTLLVLASTYPRWQNDFEPGFVHQLCRRLTTRFRVIALVPDASNADPSGDMDGVEVVRYRYAPRAWQTLVNNGGIAANLKRAPWKWLLIPGFLFAQYAAARHIIRSRHIDVIHAHWLIPQGVIAHYLARGTRPVPYLVTSHGGDLFGLRSRFAIAFKRRAAESATAMTVVSTAMRKEVRRLGLCSQQVHVLPMGVDFAETFKPDDSISRNATEILFVGRLIPKKGLHHLLNVLPVILSNLPNVKLTVVGFGPDEKSLKEKVRRLKLQEHVTFVGAVEQNELPAHYRRGSVLVLPFVRDPTGDQEGLPVVAMEAIGCGCPVIVGDVAGIEDLFGEMTNHVRVDAEDEAALAKAIMAVLEDPSLAQACAKSIRLRVLRRLDWTVVAEGYASIISDLVSAKTSVRK